MATMLTLSLSAATRIWTGTGNASTGSNWSGGIAPSPTDDVEVNAGGNMTWDLPLSINSWSQGAAYTGTVTIDTKYAGNEVFDVANDLTVIGGSVTHPLNAGSQISRLQIDVGGNFILGTGGTIDVVGKGFQAGTGPGAGIWSPISGPSHGGRGSVNNNTYGSITEPVALGSGGRTGGRGGGAVRIEVAGASTIDGTINAAGGAGTGQGSGGSIYLKTGSLSGSGTLDATAPASTGGGGGSTAAGGGRIGVVLTGSSSFGGVTMVANGNTPAGGTLPSGGAGTVYLETSTQAAGTGKLIIDNASKPPGSGLWTSMAGAAQNWGQFSEIVIQNNGNLFVDGDDTINFSTATITASGRDSATVTVAGGATVTYPAAFTVSGYTLDFAGPQTLAGSLIVSPTGRITHPQNGGSAAYKLDLTIGGSLTVDAGGEINVQDKGYQAGSGPGAGIWSPALGPSHGGRGSSMNTTYGSITQPVTIGSGGRPNGSHGGGAIKLTVAGSSTVNGSVNARGGNGTGQGAGGSIWLTTSALSGGGSLDASAPLSNGGGGGSTGAGGGRIAVHLTGSTSTAVTMTATGGARSTGIDAGGAGTVYLETTAHSPGGGVLTIDNAGLTAAGGNWTSVENASVNYGLFSAINLSGNAALAIDSDDVIDFGTAAVSGSGRDSASVVVLTGAGATFPATFTVSGYTLEVNGSLSLAGNLVVPSTGRLTHALNATTETFSLDIAVGGNLTVDAGGEINADDKGYAGGFGPGAGIWSPAFGPNHGGRANPTNDTYGSILEPVNLGSGGRGSGGAHGGGALRLVVAGSTLLDGEITALGGNGSGQGAGGSVYLKTGTLSGGGTLSVASPKSNGGGGGSTAGGGGRAAIVLTSGNSFGGVAMLANGNTTQNGTSAGGSAGTFYTETASQGSGNGIIAVNNQGNLSTFATDFPPSAGVLDVLDGATLHLQNSTVQLTADETIGDLLIDAGHTLDLAGFTLTVLTCEHALDGTVTDSVGGGALIWMDLEPPVITCPPDQLGLLSGSATDPSATGSATATENCTTATVTYGDVTLLGGGSLTITRTWTATDDDNNAATCVQTIAVEFCELCDEALTTSFWNTLCGDGSSPAPPSSVQEILAEAQQVAATLVAQGGYCETCVDDLIQLVNDLLSP